MISLGLFYFAEEKLHKIYRMLPQAISRVYPSRHRDAVRVFYHMALYPPTTYQNKSKKIRTHKTMPSIEPSGFGFSFFSSFGNCTGSMIKGYCGVSLILVDLLGMFCYDVPRFFHNIGAISFVHLDQV
ncbi:MAG: hypothetical protein ONA90_10330 [candidate division KSB1 bacterium]|nr:hypothetical protein [candidate division KSB1 bacterium]